MVSEMVDKLRPDCAACFGLCCVALPFSKSSDFGADKPAGKPCRNLLADFRCGIHTELRDRGYSGCTVFDCFGAGQRVSRETFRGVNWRDEPRVTDEMFAVFPVMRQLHELLYYLAEADRLSGGQPDVRQAARETDGLASGDPASLMSVDITAHREKVNRILTEVSETARRRFRPTKDHRGALLIGAAMPRADLRGANLRGAVLIAADLRRAELHMADLTGADLRDTDLRGADLSGAIFVTQAQLTAARGDRTTRIPPGLSRPAHWVSDA